VVRLRSEKLLDDRGFAARYARSRLQHRGLGRHRLRQGLRAKGVPLGTAEAGLKEALDQVSEGDVLDSVARRYWKSRAREDPERRLRNLWAFLLRRGFPATLILSRLKALWPRWQDALDGLEPVEPEAVNDEEE
jgi:SOS response regulatory protein OraA/RecX